ncbi:hypothetical protein SDC9_179330 [bioreactor metagenome]|uniref:Uncharacterized protein n=1 Tax=bioreactor metagenome TaxID=1076179 RepID=A0A645GYF7_9ZZZZ
MKRGAQIPRELVHIGVKEQRSVVQRDGVAETESVAGEFAAAGGEVVAA